MQRFYSMTTKNIIRRAAFLARCLLKKDVFVRRDVRIRRRMLGGDTEGEGAWTIHPDIVGKDTVVYSAGVGTDVSFDLALIRQFGVTVHAFDPTPKSLDWLAQQELPPQFEFHPIALGAADGDLTVHAPTDARFVSHSQVPHSGARGEAVTVPARRLSSIMEELGHDRIGILKLDIEGSEYDVIDDLLASGLKVEQLLVEVHHRFDKIDLDQSRAAVRRLREAGFRLFHVSPRGEEYSFIHGSRLLRNEISAAE